MVYEGVDSIKVVRFIDGFGEKVIFSAEALRQVVELEAFAEHDKGKVPKGGKVLRLFPSHACLMRAAASLFSAAWAK